MTAAALIRDECRKVGDAIADLEHQLVVKHAELSGLHRALAAIGESVIPWTAPIAQPSSDAPTRPQPTSEERKAAVAASKTLADEILASLEALTQARPKGPTVKDIAAHLAEEEPNVRKACHQLQKERRAQFMRRKDDGAYHLLPMGMRPPVDELTRSQAGLLTAMKALADLNGCVQKTRKELCEATGESPNSFAALISALLTKRRIAIVANGDVRAPTTYRILELEGARS